MLYIVSEAQLADIDRLEGHPMGRYNRQEIELLEPAGHCAWLYLVKKIDWGSNVVPSGDWFLYKRGVSVQEAATRLWKGP